MRPNDYLKFQEYEHNGVTYQTDCDGHLWKCEYEGNWRPDPLPPFKLRNPKYSITTTKVDPSPYPIISDEVRDKHFNYPYIIDEQALLEYKHPVTTWLQNYLEQFAKEKEKAMFNVNDVLVKVDGNYYKPTHIEVMKSIDLCSSIMRIECPVDRIPYHTITPKKPEPKFPEIKKVIFNDPATIVLWSDDTKTVVKCGENDQFDPEKGLAMAITKKALGNMGHYFETVKKWTRDYVDPNMVVRTDLDKTFKASIEAMKCFFRMKEDNNDPKTENC